jgi:hypothetical protein
MERRANPVVHSMYWNNIDPIIVEGQKKVFDTLGIPLQQHNADRVEHGKWMDKIAQNYDEDDSIIVFCDIDAFPITNEAYVNAIEAALANQIFGLAHFSTHKPMKRIFPGPVFMALKRSIWTKLGKPSFQRSIKHDTAGGITLAAIENHISLNIVKPACCLKPKWAMGNQGILGIGTFYGDCDFFHLFESRERVNTNLFSAVVHNVVNHQPLDFTKYLEIAAALDNSGSSIVRRIFGQS